MLIVDSREKKWSHIKAYLDKHNIEYTVKKNDVADYVRDDVHCIAVDRKRHLGEVLMNLCSRDSSRFWRELRKAHQQRMKIIFLVEINRVKVDGEWHPITCVSDVAKSGWQSKYSSVTCGQVADRMLRASMAYGVEWIFCSKRQTGETICRILGLTK